MSTWRALTVRPRKRGKHPPFPPTLRCPDSCRRVCVWTEGIVKDRVIRLGFRLVLVFRRTNTLAGSHGSGSAHRLWHEVLALLDHRTLSSVGLFLGRGGLTQLHPGEKTPERRPTLSGLANGWDGPTLRRCFDAKLVWPLEAIEPHRIHSRKLT